MMNIMKIRNKGHHWGDGDASSSEEEDENSNLGDEVGKELMDLHKSCIRKEVNEEGDDNNSCRSSSSIISSATEDERKNKEKESAEAVK